MKLQIHTIDAEVLAQDESAEAVRRRVRDLWNDIRKAILDPSEEKDLARGAIRRLAAVAAVAAPGERSPQLKAGQAALPDMHYRRWTKTEILEFRDRAQRGQDIRQISAALGRTPQALRSKAFLLSIRIAGLPNATGNE